jgi:hypothetical protein
MRKTIIFGALAGLLGLAAAAQASDDRSVTPGAAQATQERTTDGRDQDHDRVERRDRTRDMRENHDDRANHDEAGERQRRDRH